MSGSYDASVFLLEYGSWCLIRWFPIHLLWCTMMSSTLFEILLAIDRSALGNCCQFDRWQAAKVNAVMPSDLSHSCHILVLSCLIKCSSFVLQLLSLSFLPHSSLSCSSWQSFCCVLFLQLMSGWIKVISIMVYSGDWKEIDGWVVSSESCSFQSVGAKYFREVLPGI